jgi:hypothetical protein
MVKKQTKKYDNLSKKVVIGLPFASYLGQNI